MREKRDNKPRILSKLGTVLMMLVVFAVILPLSSVKAEASSEYTTLGNAYVKNGIINLSNGNTWTTGGYQLNKKINLDGNVTIEYMEQIVDSGRGICGYGAGDGIWMMVSQKPMTKGNFPYRRWYGTNELNTYFSFVAHTYYLRGNTGYSENHLDLGTGVCEHGNCASEAENTLTDGKWHRIKVVVSNREKATVYYDGVKRLSIELNNCPKSAYLAFGSFSGYMAGYHRIKNLKITSETVEFNDSEVKMNVGASKTLKYVYTGKKSAKASFSSSNPSVAKVSSTGKVVAVAPGVTYIKVKVNGLSDTCKVIVLPKKVRGLKKDSATKTSIDLVWNKQANVSGYEIWMYDKDLEEFSRVKSIDKNVDGATISGLKRGTSYKFYIKSYIRVGGKKYYGDKSDYCTAGTSK